MSAWKMTGGSGPAAPMPVLPGSKAPETLITEQSRPERPTQVIPLELFAVSARRVLIR